MENAISPCVKDLKGVFESAAELAAALQLSKFRNTLDAYITPLLTLLTTLGTPLTHGDLTGNSINGKIDVSVQTNFDNCEDNSIGDATKKHESVTLLPPPAAAAAAAAAAGGRAFRCQTRGSSGELGTASNRSSLTRGTASNRCGTGRPCSARRGGGALREQRMILKICPYCVRDLIPNA